MTIAKESPAIILTEEEEILVKTARELPLSHKGEVMGVIRETLGLFKQQPPLEALTLKWRAREAIKPPTGWEDLQAMIQFRCKVNPEINIVDMGPGENNVGPEWVAHIDVPRSPFGVCQLWIYDTDYERLFSRCGQVAEVGGIRVRGFITFDTLRGAKDDPDPYRVDYCKHIVNATEFEPWVTVMTV